MDREALGRWLAEGDSLEAIARRTGMHPSTVGAWVRKHGLDVPLAGKHAAKGPLSRDVLAGLVERGLSVRQIAAEVDRSPSTVRHWLTRYGLRTAERRGPKPRHPVPDGAPREADLACPTHGLTPHRQVGDRGYRCLRCRSEAVASRRRRVKKILVAEAGGACLLCGYDRHPAALHFHHLEPATKAFNLAYRGSTRSLDRARDEARKCALLCANCHAEVEAGVATLP
jgi:transposase